MSFPLNLTIIKLENRSWAGKNTPHNAKPGFVFYIIFTSI